MGEGGWRRELSIVLRLQAALLQQSLVGTHLQVGEALLGQAPREEWESQCSNQTIPCSQAIDSGK